MSCALHLFIEKITKGVIKASNIPGDNETVRENEEALLRSMTGNALALINKQGAKMNHSIGLRGNIDLAEQCSTTLDDGGEG